MDGANAGARGRHAAQYGPRDSERVGIAATPHSDITFSPDTQFEPKLLDIVALYLKPPENALVLCVDEKPGIQALDRTQPPLPLRAKKPQSWTNEYVRHGTQTLIAALEIARQGGRSCPQPAHLGELAPLHE